MSKPINGSIYPTNGSKYQTDGILYTSLLINGSKYPINGMLILLTCTNVLFIGLMNGT